MKKIDWFLTSVFVLAWGANFTVSKVGIGIMPPMLLASLRFVLVALPACLLVRPPRIARRYLFAYGALVIGTFAFSFYGIYIGMPAGLASVVSQCSSFITILLAALFYRERLQARQAIGLLIAAAGLGLIGLSAAPAGGAAIPLLALVLSIVSAGFWSLASLVAKHAAMVAARSGETLSMVSLVAWAALIPPIPLLALAFAMDPPGVVWAAVHDISLPTVLALLFLAWGSTLLGTSIWNHLMASYETGRVAPLSLMVPVVGLLVARIALNERMSALQWAGSIIIIVGLAVFNLGPGLASRLLALVRRHA